MKIFLASMTIAVLSAVLFGCSRERIQRFDGENSIVVTTKGDRNAYNSCGTASMEGTTLTINDARVLYPTLDKNNQPINYAISERVIVLHVDSIVVIRMKNNDNVCRIDLK